MENKNKKKYLILIILLIVMVFGLSGYIVYDKVIDKNEDNIVEEDEKSNKKQYSVITKEEAEIFLNNLVKDYVYVDLLISNSDEEIFLNSIRSLYLNKQYTQSGDYYVFKQKDIKDLARKYYMNENFEYIYTSTNSGFEYDSTSQTYRSLLNFGLFSTGPAFEKMKVIESFNYDSGVASLTYQVKIVYDSTYLANPDDNTKVYNYQIELIKVNEELRIKSISLI